MKLPTQIAALGLATVCGLAAASTASAAVTFAGSWEVDQGPFFAENAPGAPDGSGPIAYTGQETAAMLFGGSSSDYVISTGSSYINREAWYSIIGYGAAMESQSYDDKYEGQYYGPTFAYNFDDPSAAASAFVNDNAMGPQFTNYAFRVTGVSAAPEPASWVLMIAGVAGLGLALRRKPSVTTATA